MASLFDSIFSASKYGRVDDIKDLLKENVDFNSTDELGNTPLHYAAGAGHVEIVDLLVQSGKVKLNIQNGHGDTPLHKAAQKDSGRHVEVVKILIEANAQTDIKNSEGLTPYDLARNGEIKSLVEPVVEIPGYNPYEESSESEEENDEDEDDDDDE